MDFSEFVKGNSLELYMKTINISELVSFLQSNLSITKLSLKSCYIDDEGALANGNLANLTKLDLSWNNIGDEGAKALTSIKNFTLCGLDGNSTSIKGKGDFDITSLMNNIRGGSSIDIFDQLK